MKVHSTLGQWLSGSNLPALPLAIEMEKARGWAFSGGNGNDYLFMKV